MRPSPVHMCRLIGRTLEARCGREHLMLCSSSQLALPEFRYIRALFHMYSQIGRAPGARRGQEHPMPCS